MAIGVIRRQLRIQKQLDEFLDQVSEAALMFMQGMDFYLKEENDAFAEKLQQISRVEHNGDEMRRAIERELYLKTLIPESRSDVLELLERLDSLLDQCKGVLWQFEIELPDVPEEHHLEMRELVEYSVKAVESIVRSSRAFFKEIGAVNDHMHKVSYWETESDKVATRMLMSIYRREDLSLCHKSQLKDLVDRVSRIADKAEDVADRLSIFVIKRML